MTETAVESPLARGGEHITEPVAPAATPKADVPAAMPEGGHEKFWDAKTSTYNWQGHAKELEFKASQKKAPEAPVADEVAAQETVEKAGLDWDALGKQIADTGDIKASDRQALVDIGIRDDVIDTYIDAVHGKAQKHYEAVEGAFGGKAELDAAVAWAKANLTVPERIKIEADLNDPNGWQTAVAGIRARMGAPPLRGGNQQTGGTGAKGYATQAEMAADMRDPRYRTSPAFRAEVMERAKATEGSWPTRMGGAGL